MTSILSKEERLQVINSHKKNLAVNQYNLVISLIEENAKVNPDTGVVASLTDNKNAIDNQITALDNEAALVAAEPDPSK